MSKTCQKCGREFVPEDRAASMSGSIMGDEHTDSWFLCPVCRLYTVVSWHDNFTGIETMRISGPFPKEQGDERIGLINRCPSPWNKKCRCEAHREYFRGALD